MRTHLVIALCCLMTVLYAPLAADSRTAQLKTAVRTADRIEVSDTAGYVDEHMQSVDPGPFSLIEGSEVAGDFMSSFALSDDQLAAPCCCEGILKIGFYRGQSLLAELYLHKGWLADWRKGPYEGFIPIDTACRTALTRWLKAHGAARLVDQLQDKEANQALLPTTTAVTPPAAQEPRQP